MSLNSRDTSIGKTNEERKYKQTEVGLIPVDWDVCDLHDAVDFLDGMRRPVKSGDRAKISGVFPYYGASGIVDYVNDYIFDDELILLGEDGENILSRNLPLAFKVSGKIWVNNHAHVLKPKSSFDITFLTEFLESLDYSLLNSGTAQPKLNKKSCLKIKIAKPALEEQTAIANALSDVDALIQELEKLIAKKQAIKTATMQQLLTGRTRLPQFAHNPDGRKKGYKPSELGEIPEDWEVLPFNKIFNYQNGKAQEHLFNSNDGYKVISIGNYSESGKYIETGSYIDKKHAGEISRFVLKTGELAMILNDKTAVGTIIGRVILIDKNDTYVMNQRTMRLSPTEVFNSKYLFALINSEFVHKRIVGMAKPGTQIYINTDDVLEFQVQLPKSKDEQTAIANMHIDMDKEVQTLEQRLAKTRQIKQGMMRELLTGKTRLVKPAGAA